LPISDRPAVGAIQRARILDAVVEVVAERGAVDASVELVIARAGVSRYGFHEQFDGLEECLMAVLDGGLERVASLAAHAIEQERGPWQDGMRAALAAVLEFFDSERDLAKVCLVETLAAGPVVREHRERATEAFRALVVGRIQSEVSHASPLAAEGLLGSVMSVVHARLIAREQKPLIELLGPLMGVIVGPFVDEHQLAREIERGDRLAREVIAGRRSPAAQTRPVARVDVPGVLLSARAHRARQCLLYVVRHPGASNQEVGEAIGVSHRGQLAKLLGKLAALGLLVKRAGGPGRANAWSATTAGEDVALALAGNGGHSRLLTDV
jgi:AcrR family transcriptional regulator